MDEEYGFNFKWNESKWLTRQSLLVRMENADEYVLDEFFRKYLPFIVMIAKKVKLSYQDTKELIDMVYDGEVIEDEDLILPSERETENQKYMFL